MTGTTFGALVVQDNANIRKALKGGVLMAPMATALPTALTSGATPALNVLTGFNSLGFFDDTGAVISEKIAVQDVMAWGKTIPVRTDITSDITTVKVVALETNLYTLAAFFRVPTSALVPNVTTGELVVTKNISPTVNNQRVLILSQDGIAGSEFWFAQLLPMAAVTAIGNRSYNSAKQTITYDMTLTAYEDPVAGFDVQEFFAGPGWLAGATAEDGA
jgi:hypothetical protein